MNKKRTGVITVEAVFVMPIVMGVIILLYSLIITQYNNVLFRTAAIQITNRVGANWNQINGNGYTILKEDMYAPVVFEGETSNVPGKTGKNVITSKIYADNDPYAPIMQLASGGGSQKISNINNYYKNMMTKAVGDRFALMDVSVRGIRDKGFSVWELIFGGTFDITVKNEYSNGLLDIVKGFGYDIEKSNTVKIKANFSDPVEFVRNVDFVKEVIQDLKEEKSKNKTQEK